MKKVLAISALFGLAAFSQNTTPKAPTDEALYIGEAQLQKIMTSAPASPKTGKPGSFSARLFDGGAYSTAFIRLDEPDQPHAHGDWSEVLVIKEGSAIVETGGTITGDVKPGSAVHQSIFIDPVTGQPRPQQPQAQAQKNAPGPGRRTSGRDISGSAIEGGHKQRVEPGDIILVPAGVAHTFLQVDKPIVYLDIKFLPSKAQ